MKKVAIFIIIIFTLCLSSCREDTTQLAKDEFSKYYNEKNEVALILGDTIYFEEYELDLNGINKDEEANNGLIFKSDKFYFSTSKQNGMFDYTLKIYESNLLGTELKLLFSKDNYKTHPWVYGIDDIFYIEHYSDNALNGNSKKIDRFLVVSNEYENIDSGKDCSLSDYIPKEETSKYDIEIEKNISPKEHGKFIITDLETSNKKVIDDQYLKDTIYIESIEKFNYGPERFDISNGHILLTYGIGAGDGWNYPHLVFEYDFNSNTLEYKLLAFPFDSVPIDIIWINEQ